MIKLRHARPADLSEILSFPLNREELFYFYPSAKYPLTIEQLSTQLEQRYESTVMLENNQIVGYANFYNVENHHIAFIGNVIIKPEKRGKGLGKKLLQSMIEIGLKRLHLEEIHLSCYNSNTRALLFYNHLGFKPYALEKRVDYKNNQVALIHLRLKKLS